MGACMGMCMCMLHELYRPVQAYVREHVHGRVRAWCTCMGMRVGTGMVCAGACKRHEPSQHAAMHHTRVQSVHANAAMR